MHHCLRHCSCSHKVLVGLVQLNNTPTPSPWCKRVLVLHQQSVGAALKPVFLAKSWFFAGSLALEMHRTVSRSGTDSEVALETWTANGICDCRSHLNLCVLTNLPPENKVYSQLARQITIIRAVYRNYTLKEIQFSSKVSINIFFSIFRFSFRWIQKLNWVILSLSQFHMFLKT